MPRTKTKTAPRGSKTYARKVAAYYSAIRRATRLATQLEAIAARHEPYPNFDCPIELNPFAPTLEEEIRQRKPLPVDPA